MEFSFSQVDVFSKLSCKGNPVCVFLNSKGLSAENMQAVANWTNLSETTFAEPVSNSEYQVRIFTVKNELPFAGHPTLGTAWALLEGGYIQGKSIIQHCAYGAVEIKREDNTLFFALPKYTHLKDIDDQAIEKFCHSRVKDSLLIDSGPHWMVGIMKNLSDLDNLNLDKSSLAQQIKIHNAEGICSYVIDKNATVHVRTFFDAGTDIVEDPVCGSGNAAVAAHIKITNRTNLTGKTYHARQGKHLGRDGRIAVRIGDKIEIGGECNTVFTGKSKLQF